MTVTAGQDDDGEHDRAALSHTITTACDAAGYPTTLAIPSVEVTVNDDAAPPPVPTDRQPTFGAATVETQRYTVDTAVTLTLPAARGGDGRLTYTLTPPALPVGLTYMPPAAVDATGGTLAGTPTAVHPATTYTLTATDTDGDTATLTFAVEVGAAGAIRQREGTTTYTVNGQRVTVTQAPGTLAGVALTVTQPATLDRAVTITVRPPGADVPLVRGRYGFGPAGAQALDDRRVEPPETFTVTVTLPAETWIELAKATVEGRIKDDDTERARKRSVRMVLAGAGRTLATDAVDVIGDRFERQPTAVQATVGGQAFDLERTPQRGRWRHAAGGRGRAVRAGTRRGVEHVDAASAQSTGAHPAAGRLGRAGRLRRSGRAKL